MAGGNDLKFLQIIYISSVINCTNNTIIYRIVVNVVLSKYYISNASRRIEIIFLNEMFANYCYIYLFICMFKRANPVTIIDMSRIYNNIYCYSY